MARRCALCGHAQQAEIDERLRGKINMLRFSRELGLSRDQLIRHRDNHVLHKTRVSPDQGDDTAEPPPRGKGDPKTAFLTAYAATCDMKQGLAAAGITRAQFRKWQEQDTQFSLRFKQAETEAVEALEYEARIRAIAGSKLVRRVYRGGVLYEEIHEFRPSDAMMTRLLQAAKPEKYGDKLTVTQTTVVKAIDAGAWNSV